MCIAELQHRLLLDLRHLGLPIDEVDLFLRPYSKTYYGRYFPSTVETERAKIYVYPFNNDNETIMNYDKILETLIHELCHHIQYSSGCVRLKGVMHNSHFWKLYNHYTDKARQFNMLGGEECEKAI